nr:restriction endonuclease subunit S [Ruminococcus sp.]
MTSEWRNVLLGSVCKVSSSKRIFAKEYRTNGIPFYRGKEIVEKHNGHKASTELFISKEKYDEIKHKYDTPKIGDVLLTSVGTLGVPWYVTETDFYFKDGNLTWLRADSEYLDSKFLYLWLNSTFAKIQIDKMCIGSTQKALTIDTITKFIITLPPLHEQQRIVAILWSIKDRIALNTAINEKLEQLIAAYYKELFGNCDYTAKISDYAGRVFSGGTPTTSNERYWNGGYNWLSSGETCQKFIVDTEKTITQKGIDNSSTRLASKYDTVIASAGQGHTRGQTSMLLTNSYVNQSIIAVHSEKVYAPFIYWNLCGRYEELRVISNYNSIRGSLTTKMISSFSAPKADISVISQFSEFAWAAIHEIENNCNENIRLTALRDTLLPKLMSGEIDVSNVQV